MYIEIKQLPTTVAQIACECKNCHRAVTFSFLWHMSSRTTRRKGKYGRYSNYAYSCDACQHLLVVGHWQIDSTISIDDYLADLRKNQ